MKKSEKNEPDEQICRSLKTPVKIGVLAREMNVSPKSIALLLKLPFDKYNVLLNHELSTENEKKIRDHFIDDSIMKEKSSKLIILNTKQAIKEIEHPTLTDENIPKMIKRDLPNSKGRKRHKRKNKTKSSANKYQKDAHVIMNRYRVRGGLCNGK